MNSVILFICQECKQEVQKTSKNQKFCSKCKFRTATCLFCNLTFPLKRKNRKYCSQQCAKKDSEKKTLVNCYYCDKKFEIWNSNNYKKKHFCSKEHSLAWQVEKAPHKKCKLCSKEYTGSRPKYYCSTFCHLNDPDNIQRLINMRIKQSKTKINKFETKVYQLLDKISINYEKQFNIDNKFVVDAFIPSINLVIWCDGDYWHGNPKVFPNLNKSQIARQLLDIKQSNYVADVKNYKFFRIWEIDFKNQKSDIEDKLINLFKGV